MSQEQAGGAVRPGAAAPTTPARTGTFDALGHRFAVVGDPGVVAQLERAYAPLASAGAPARWYGIVRSGDRGALVSNRRLVARAGLTEVLDHLHADVRRRAVAAAGDDLVLHAGCVGLDGHAILVSGGPGCGTAPLVAALVERGCEYLSDEVVPVELAGGRVRPFPGPLALHDPAGAIGSPSRVTVSRHSALRVTMVVFGEADASGITLLQRLNHGDAIVRLAERAFNFPSHEGVAMDTLSGVLRSADPHVLVGEDPRTAASAVIDAFRAGIRGPMAPEPSAVATIWSPDEGPRMCPGRVQTPV
jgi:hypothetical protein